MSKRTALYRCSCGSSFQSYRAVLDHIRDTHQKSHKAFGIYRRIGNLTTVDASQILSESDMQQRIVRDK